LMLSLLGALSVALLVRAAGPATQPAPVRYHEEVRSNPPLHMHVVTIDLTDPRVSLRVVRSGDDPDGAGPWQSKLDTVRNVAAREHFVAAVNGNFFTTKDAVSLLGKKIPYYAGNWCRVTGYAMTDGVLWANEPTSAMLVVDASNTVRIGTFAKVPADARQVVSSGEILVVNGKNVGKSPDTAPRTSIGVDRSGKHVTMLVVDGRREGFSAGLNGQQLGEEMIRLGCSDALILDGGGSSTMVFRDADDQAPRLVNHPSDGHTLPFDLSIERPVAD